MKKESLEKDSESDDIARQRLEMWNARAEMGFAAGTNDVNLKRLEIDWITKVLRDQESLLDVGCGNGGTAVEVAKRFSKKVITGIDYSENMIAEATNHAMDVGVSDNTSFHCADMLVWVGELEGCFDGIYTERSLINLGTLEEQKVAMEHIGRYASPGARLVLCESFNDGLDEINNFRAKANLEAIVAPWHNRYLNLAELSDLIPPTLELMEIIDFSSTYYFVSRVINAWEARRHGEEPNYGSSLNLLALQLPLIDKCAQTKAIVLKKNGS